MVLELKSMTLMFPIPFLRTEIYFCNKTEHIWCICLILYTNKILQKIIIKYKEFKSRVRAILGLRRDGDQHSFGLIIWIANYFLFKFWISGVSIFTIHNVVSAGLTYLGGAYLRVLLYTTSAQMCGDLIYDDKTKVGFIYTFWCSLSSTSSILD